MEKVIIVVCAYLLGAIPFGFLVGKIKGLDIRQHGSGNMGFTNVWRTLGFAPGLLVLICDGAKGFLAAAIGFQLMGVHGTLLGGVVAIFGHTFSCFMQFKGGKGVATGGGVLLFMSPVTLAICLAAVIIIAAVTKYMSLGSVIAAWMAPVVLYATGAPQEYVIGIGAAALYVIILHIPNLQRLAKGKENKIGHKAKEQKGGTV